MRYVQADLQKMKRSRTLCIRTYTHIPNILCRWQRNSWSDLTNVWKRKGDRGSKTTACLFLCALCRRKKDISCPYLLISPRIVDGKMWQFLVFSATYTFKTCLFFSIRTILLCHIFIFCTPSRRHRAIQFIVTQQQLGKLLSGEGATKQRRGTGCSHTLQCLS